MNEYHSLLRRQLRRLLGAETSPPEAWTDLLRDVDEAYRQLDQDRTLLERSMEISSQELLQANADIRAVLDGLIDYYIRLDKAGRILYARGESVPVLFVPGAVTPGRALLEVVLPEMRTLFGNLSGQMNARPDLRIVHVAVGNGNRQSHFEVRLVPAHGGQCSVIFRDITEAHNLDERERELQRRLARAERIESLGVLAGGVAHDLNNILSPLVSYPDLILADLPAGTPSRTIVKQMQKSAMRAAAIIQDLMTLARRGNHQMELVDINEVIHTYTESPDFQALKKRSPEIEIAIDLADHLPMLKGAPHQLSQAVMNLVTNAFEAIKGAGRIAITTSPSNRQDSYQTPDHHGDAPLPDVLLQVADTGSGIPEDEIDHVFEPFFTRRKKGKSGTGLGLAIVYGMVKDFGGSIEVESKPGEGTRFLLAFPGAARPEHSGAPPDAGAMPSLPPHRILVVDDEPVQRELCRLLLNSKGCEVVMAATGREALDYLRNHDVDIVLLDMIMEPDFDGLRTYEALRAFKPEQRCIIVSGFAESENVRSALALGVRAFVQKPYTLNTLYAAIQKAVKSG